MSVPNVSLSEISTINPKGPARGEIGRDEVLEFVPMAAVSEKGYMDVTESRAYSDVSKGFTAFKRGDVLVAKITPCYENNKIAKSTIETSYGFGSTEFHVVRTNAEALDPDYLTHFLRQDCIRTAGERRMTGSGGQRRVPKSFLEELKIPLPPLEEQKRIAGILDQADALRRLRTRALDRLNTLGQAIFHEMFGDFSSYTSLPFAEVIHDIGNGVSPSRNGTLEDTVLTLSAITGQSFDATKQKVDTFAAAVPANKRVEAGDFLLCRGNGNPDLVGSGKLADESGQGVVYPDTIMRAKLNDARVDPQYISVLWRHSHIRKQITAGAKTTNGTMKINQEVVRNISIPMPPLEKQIEFGFRLTALQRLQASHSEAAHGESALFASLQHKAFQGEL